MKSWYQSHARHFFIVFIVIVVDKKVVERFAWPLVLINEALMHRPSLHAGTPGRRIGQLVEASIANLPLRRILLERIYNESANLCVGA
jgi:hypothetical protein